MIAATAIFHDLIVVTRNVRDFAAFGAIARDPISATPLVRRRAAASSHSVIGLPPNHGVRSLSSICVTGRGRGQSVSCAST